MGKVGHGRKRIWRSGSFEWWDRLCGRVERTSAFCLYKIMMMAEKVASLWQLVISISVLPWLVAGT